MPTLLDDIQEATLDRIRGDQEHSLTTLTACAIIRTIRVIPCDENG